MQLLDVYNSLYENDLYISDYIDFKENDDITHSGSREIDTHEIEDIKFVNVSFSYPNSSKAALRKITFEIKKGEKVLITGENGSGKTTLIKLLLRLYEPSEGEILINNINIREFEITKLRMAISVLFQDYALYAFTILENLCLGQKIPYGKISKILEELRLNNIIKSLPYGLNTPISCQFDDNGVELSGGEKQRLAIARAILRETDFFILDEPMSNLDTKSENSVYSMIFRNKSATAIVISHQLRFASQMSKIYYLDNGEIVESGTHEELFNSKDGLYHKLYQSQINDEIE